MEDAKQKQHRTAGLVLSLILLALPVHTMAESTVISDTLPIDVQVDLLMAELSNLLKRDDNQGIVELIPRIRSLEIEIPDSLNFLEANSLFRTGRALEARDRLLAYLANTGRDGKYYEQASELLLQVKERAAAEERAQAAELAREAERRQQAASRALVLRTRNAQRLLYDLGFPIEENGELNTVTREAIAVYQIRNDLTVNARVTDELMTSLKSSVPDTHNCDSLAEYSRGPASWGVAISDIASSVAIPTCNEALRLYPNAIRFQVQYARALVSANRSEDAMNAIEHAARLGYPEAEMLIGQMHAMGLLSEKGKSDYVSAVRWYRLAADRNYPEAQRRLAELYRNGLGIKRAETTAVEWYHKAASQGYAPAQVDLGQMYSAGRGVKRNYLTALEWYNKAAKSGYPMAEFYLGDAYERGKGVKRDKNQALSWFRKAGQQGLQEAAERVKRLGG